MISETYLKLLKSEVKKIDELTKSTYEFEIILQDIVNNVKNSELEFVKRLGNLSNNETFPTMKDKQSNILEILYKYLGARVIDANYTILKESNTKSFEILSNELNSLIGLENVKKEIEGLVTFNKIQKVRENLGLKKTNRTMHMAFLGNPGTAKTTVARIVGNMYRSLGLLSKGHFIEASRTDLIAEYQGQTAIKVKRIIQKAIGGVLFIDEAYSITENDKSDSYGRECLTELTKALEDYRSDLVVIVAGYEDLMNQFFDSNPGLKSRFNYFIHFKDYSVEELLEIFLYICTENDYLISKEAQEKVKQSKSKITEYEAQEKVKDIFQKSINEKDNLKSNGRLARNIFDTVVMNQAKRLARYQSFSKETLKLITSEDIFIENKD